MLVAVLAVLAALALPTASAFGEGSVNFNPASGPEERHSLSVANPDGSLTLRSALSVYAQAGETVQMASSLVGVGGNIRIFAPGDDPTTATPLLDCALSQPLNGRIASRAQELAGPQPNAGGYDACDFTVPADGIYTVIMSGTANANGPSGTVDDPRVDALQGFNASMWDVTVRDAAGAVQPGRLFSSSMQLRTTCNGLVVPAANGQAYVYTKTGYEYQVNVYSHAGCNWVLTSDDKGIVDAVTGERIFASYGIPSGPRQAGPAAVSGGGVAALATQWPLFVNRIDPLVVSGPGGLGERFGYSDTAIAPSSNPLANAAFTGSGGQAGATNRGTGGTISFTSPTQMAGIAPTLEIDTDRNGTFGDGTDYVDDSGALTASGNNSLAWNGLDAAGNVPACGDYTYRVRSTIAEVHFTQLDVENSGGTSIERLSLPGDASLGNVLAASYNNRDPYTGAILTNGTPSVATNAISGPGFNSWTDNTGDTDFIDTWSRLPEVQTTGTLRLLCADPQVVKTVEPAAVVPGEDATFKLEVKNNGPDAATDLSVVDDLPDTVTFKSASQGCSEAASVVTCSLASLAPNATHTFEIVVEVPSSLDECIENSATVTNTTFDTNIANNTSADCFKINRRSDLSITKDPSSATVASGGQVMYTLVVRNHGPSDDPDAKVSDPLAAGLSLVSAQPAQGTCTTTNNKVACELGTLKDGGSTQILVTANVTAPAGACGPNAINNTATVSGANTDPTPDNNQDSAQICTDPPPDPQFDLVVSKTANDRSLLVGQKVTYRVTVRNNGPATAPDVTLTDTINAPVKVVSVRASQGSCQRRIPMRCELGTIAAGDSVTIRIVAKHREASSSCRRDRQRQAASATGAGTDTNPANNLATVDVCVRKVPLKLSKVASREVVRAGDTLSYRIRVRNPTKGQARNAKVCDRLPSGLSFVSSKPRAKRSGGQRCWTIKSLNAGKSRTFRVTVRTAKGANGRKVNRATLTGPDTKRLRAKDPIRVLGQATPVTG